MSRSEGPVRTFIYCSCKGFLSVLNARSPTGSQNVILCVLVKITSLIGQISDCLHPPSFQIPQCYPDHVPTHLALPNHSGHYKQGCPQASAGSEGFGESHSAGIRPFCLFFFCLLVFTKCLLQIIVNRPDQSLKDE